MMKDIVIGIVAGVSLLCLIVAVIIVGVPALTEFLNSIKEPEEL